MGDEYILAQARTISYSGEFNLTDLFSTITTFLKERGFEMIERRHEYKEFPEGKVIEMFMTPMKKVTESDVVLFEFVFVANKITDKIVNKKKVNSGNVFVSLRAVLTTDAENSWDVGKGILSKYYKFIRWVSDNVIFRAQKELIKEASLKDLEELYNLITLHFNGHQYKRG